MGSFFFEDSRYFFNDFKGIAGSQKQFQAVLRKAILEKNNLHQTIKEKKINCTGLIVEFNTEGMKLKKLEAGLEGGRKVVAFIIKEKKTILQTIEETDFNFLLDTDSYFVWNGNRYNIIGFDDYINNNQTLFYTTFAGKDI